MQSARIAVGILGAAALGACSFLGVLDRAPGSARPATAPPAPERHYVTPRQLTASGTLARVPVGLDTATDQQGRAVRWADLTAGRPLAVVFIKDGCPCNVEFEPFFHRLAAAYGEVLRCVGVIDGDAAAAGRYAEANRVPYPVLADPERQIIARFQAENGAYVGLVAPGGVIEALWPGCSVEMMRELNGQIARLAGLEERAVDFTGLPGALTTGCPFRH